MCKQEALFDIQPYVNPSYRIQAEDEGLYDFDEIEKPSVDIDFAAIPQVSEIQAALANGSYVLLPDVLGHVHTFWPLEDLYPDRQLANADNTPPDFALYEGLLLERLTERRIEQFRNLQSLGFHDDDCWILLIEPEKESLFFWNGNPLSSA